MSVIGFPNPVDEVSARLVAGTVVGLSVATILFGAGWACPVIAIGFLLRVLAGPKLSPIGLTVTKLVRPRLQIQPRLTAGPPKRFAQAIGLLVSGAASIAWLVFDNQTLGMVLMGGLVVAASLEAFAGICLGCKAFAVLMRMGLIPEPVCEQCASFATRADS